MINNEASIRTIHKSKQGNYPSNLQNYFEEAGEDDLNTAFQKQAADAETLFQSISEDQSKTKYAAGKWTIKEVLQHLIDTERIFAYRALAFARKDDNILPSFDENGYAANSNANDRAWNDLISEFTAVRITTEYLYNSFSVDALNEIGKASNYTTGVTTLGFVIIGHVNHHLKIIKERYLK